MQSVPERRSEPPQAGIVLSVAEAAARVGLTPATLRTWDRRYGLAPSVRTAGGHRRYHAIDLARLRAVSRMVDAGMPAGEAVAAGLGMSDDVLAAGPDDVPPATGRPGGGRVIALPGGTDVQRGIARAAQSLDGPAITREVSALIGAHGVVVVWQEILVPVLRALGDRWENTRRGVETEHVAADAMARALQSHTVAVQRASRPVVLACMPEEQHSLPLIALQAALSQQGEPSVLLGARVPEPALADAVTRLRPRRLVLWAHDPEHANPDVVTSLAPQRPPLVVLLAGPGWDAAPLDGYDRPATLPEAVEMLGATA